MLAIEPDGRLTERASCSTLPESFDGESLGGYLAFDAAGRRLYASNRGHDSLAVFEIGGDGEPRLSQIASTGGSSPRGFLLLEEHGRMVVVHEQDGAVSILPQDADGRIGGVIKRLHVSGAAFVDYVRQG